MQYYSVQRKIFDNYVHVMKYMGSKRELLEKIESIVVKNLEKETALLDLFAGTCSVGLFLRDRYPIYSNDIQSYSTAISRGIIEIPPQNLSREKILLLLEDNYEKNYQFLVKKLQDHLKISENFIKLKKWDKKELEKYLKFIKNLPNPLNTDNTDWLVKEYRIQGEKGKRFPYLQTVFLFSEMYFSMDQAIKIDSLKYAIDNIAEEYKYLSELLNTSLIHAYSYNSAGTGHFAQFRDLNSVSSVEDVFLYRKRSVMDYFLKKAEEIIESSKNNNYYRRSASFSLDYVDLLKNREIMKKVGFVYADPPYSFVHYSRFYHAVENLCRYDYPDVEHKGRYRKDRHQSPFCIKTQVPHAFRKMFKLIYLYRIPILVSYSNTGMIDLMEIVKIAEEEGYKTELLEVDHKHSTMGRLHDKQRDVKEALLLCKLRL